jgi:hypothetical protein
LEKLNGEINKEKKEKFFQSNSETISKEEKKDDTFDISDELDDLNYDIDDIEQENKNNKFLKIKKKIRIKLVIAEICKNSTQKAFRKLLSPILTTFDTQQQFGMFHSVKNLINNRH